MRKYNQTLYTLSERDNDDDDPSWGHDELDETSGHSTSSTSSSASRAQRQLTGKFRPAVEPSGSTSSSKGNTSDIYSQFVQRYRTKEHQIDPMGDLRSDPDSHYFHRGLSQLDEVGDLSDEEEAASLLVEAAPDGYADHNLTYPLTEREQERLEWQSMLNSVLSGEVLQSEKTRIAVVLDSLGDEQNNFHINVWLGIRAKFHGRTVTDEQRKLEEKRIRIVDSVINEVMNFQVVFEDEISTSVAYDQVSKLLNRLDIAQSLYPNLKAFYLDKPKAQEGRFQSRVDTLNTWYTILTSLRRHFDRLRRWTGSDSLDVTHTNPTAEVSVGVHANSSSLRLSPDLGDGSSFVERLLKEESMQRTFEKGFLVTVHAFLGAVRDAHVNLATKFRAMNLPTFENELVPLISFPTKLAQASLRVRLDYVAKLKDPDVLIVDQMIEDLKLSIGLACTLKRQYQAFMVRDPDGNWNLPQCISEDYDTTILQALSSFFVVLYHKLKSGAKGNFLKETDILEAQWATYNDVSLTAGGSSLVATELCKLTNKLMQRVANFFAVQVNVPLSADSRPLKKRAANKAMQAHENIGLQKMTIEQKVDWYSKILDSVRQRYRKLQRFSRALMQRFSNSAEYSIDDVPMDHLISLLVLTDHFLVYTQSMEEDSTYIVASGSLYDQPDLISKILTDAFHVDEVTNEEGVRAVATDFCVHDSDEIGYLLVLTPHSPFIWNGRVQIVPVPKIALDIKESRIRLIADGSFRRLNYAKQAFIDCMESVDEEDDENLSPGPLYLRCLTSSQAHLPSVHREMRKIVRVSNRLAEAIVESVHLVKASLRDSDKPIVLDLLGNWYLFASEHGSAAQKYMERSSFVRFNRSLVKLAISWVAFIEDCDPNDRKTFRWAVNALEFTQQRVKWNILQMPDEQYDTLRQRVGTCMSLLISHFDILGARSKLEARNEKEKHEMMLRSQVVDSQAAPEDDFPSTSDAHGGMDPGAFMFWERASKAIAKMEKEKAEKAEKEAKEKDLPPRTGKVLDDEKMEDRSLVFLASSSSNISMRWQQGRFIGAGAFGSVYLALNLDTGAYMAVKEIKFQEISGLPNLYTQIKDELSVMEMLHHPHIVEYYGIEVHRDKVYIFEEYCQGGSLASLLEHGRIEDERILQVYTMQMLDGLAYLHSRHIVHRDIKPDNILLDRNGAIKFVDFGAAKILAKNQRTVQRSRRFLDPAGQFAPPLNPLSNGLTGTPMYMSPEMIKSEKRGNVSAADIWSLGCVILECATGKKPWSNLDNEWAIMFHIGVATQHPPLPEPGQLSELGIHFLEQCLTIDPLLRPSALDLVNDPWMLDLQEVIRMLETQEANLPLNADDPEAAETNAAPGINVEESMDSLASNPDLEYPPEFPPAYV